MIKTFAINSNYIQLFTDHNISKVLYIYRNKFVSTMSNNTKNKEDEPSLDKRAFKKAMEDIKNNPELYDSFED